MLAECQQHAPDLFTLFKELGQVDRFAPESGETPQSTITQLFMSLLTLVKYRSTNVLGIQLLITFMLIARSTSRQVDPNITNLPV